MPQEEYAPNTADELKVPFQENGNAKAPPPIDIAHSGATPGSPNDQAGKNFPSGAGEPSSVGGQSSTY